MALNTTTNKNIYGFSDWDNAFLNQQEKDYITGLRQQAEAGQISWGTANKAAESVRSKYGYAGGSDGSGYIAKPQKLDTAYKGGAAQDAARRQEQKLDGMSYEKFTESDDYAALLDKYTMAGKRAMDDTVGTVATRTGGLASSFAVAAGQQTFNQYMEALDDAGKELYRQEYEKERQRLQMLRDEEQKDYERFLDKVTLDRDERQHNTELGQMILDNKRHEEDLQRELKQRDAETAAATAEKAQQTAKEQVEYLLQSGLYTYEELLEKEPEMVQLAKAGGWTNAYMEKQTPVKTEEFVQELRKKGYSDLDIDGILASMGL